MKAITNLLIMVFMLSFYGVAMSHEETKLSQEEGSSPEYISMTKTHWNDDPETDFSDWLETERKYFEKLP
ncbi:hypothetical protein ML462_12110 [Gramella lutea]|uniref:Uncharacterized protein n=1 Tax=Christiangramia lutea TaxID=1607951 RepID=A0A9X2AB58_9FLAO|nr:hypothetical protein [Christiangramia lutea]MCH4823916.1 hypothetical protein [Christiangramia lutea]